MKILFPLLIAVMVILLIFSLARKKMAMVLNFCLRVVFGFIGIYFFNAGLNYFQVDALVGYNPTSLLTLGTLGFSGFFLLYGIAFGKFL